MITINIDINTISKEDFLIACEEYYDTNYKQDYIGWMAKICLIQEEYRKKVTNISSNASRLNLIYSCIRVLKALYPFCVSEIFNDKQYSIAYSTAQKIYSSIITCITNINKNLLKLQKKKKLTVENSSILNEDIFRCSEPESFKNYIRNQLVIKFSGQSHTINDYNIMYFGISEITELISLAYFDIHYKSVIDVILTELVPLIEQNVISYAKKQGVNP